MRIARYFSDVLLASADRFSPPKTVAELVAKVTAKTIREQFFEAVQLNPRDPVATPIVAQMDELFAVDAEARRKTLTTAARHIRRQETARPLLDDIRSKIDAAQSVALPSSALSKACQYALALWKKLTRFLEYPELELSTNLAENSMLKQMSDDDLYAATARPSEIPHNSQPAQADS